MEEEPVELELLEPAGIGGDLDLAEGGAAQPPLLEEEAAVTSVQPSAAVVEEEAGEEALEVAIEEGVDVETMEELALDEPAVGGCAVGNTGAEGGGDELDLGIEEAGEAGEGLDGGEEEVEVERGALRLVLGDGEREEARLALYNLQWKVTYCLTLLLAAGFLFPYNSFITAVDYFKVIFGPSVENEITLMYMTSVAIAVTSMAVVGGKPHGLRALMLSYAAFLAFLVLVPAVCFLLVPEPPASEEEFNSLPVRIAYWFTLFSVLITGIVEGTIQASLYGLGALFDSRQATAAVALGSGLGVSGEQQFYTQGVQLGTAIAGSFVSVNRITSKLLLEDETEDFRVVALRRLRYAKLYLLTDVNIVVAGEDPAVDVTISEEEAAEKMEPDDVSGVGREEDEEEVELDESGLPKTSDGNVTAKQIVRFWLQDPVKNTVSAVLLFRCLRAVSVMRQTWKMALAVGLTFMCTLVIFPGVLVKVPAEYFSQSWLTIILISSFNFSDFLGKELPVVKLLNMAPNGVVYALAIGRFAFIPLFLLCVKPLVISNEFIVIFLTILLGLTTGYTGALSMMRGPTSASVADKGQAGMLMVLSLVVGLDLGAAASYVLHLVYFE